MIFRYIWHPDVERWHQLGWMIVDVIHFDRGGHPTYLMQWPCTCSVVEPALRAESHHE